MKKRKFTTFAVALLIACGTYLLSCSSDEDGSNSMTTIEAPSTTDGKSMDSDDSDNSTDNSNSKSNEGNSSSKKDERTDSEQDDSDAIPDDFDNEGISISAPTGLTVENIESNAVILTWDKVKNATFYQTSYGTNPSGDTTETPRTKKTYQTITISEEGKLYYFWVRAGILNDEEIIWSAWSRPVNAKIKSKSSENNNSSLSAPTITDISFNTDHTGLRISWDSVKGAASYNLYYAETRDSIKGYKKINEVKITGTSADDDEYSGEFVKGSYFYKVSAVAADGTESTMSEPKGVTLKNPVVTVSLPTRTGKGTRQDPYRYYKNANIQILKNGIELPRNTTDNELQEDGTFECKVRYSYSSKAKSEYKSTGWVSLGTRDFKVGYKYTVYCRTKRIQEEPNLILEN